jgi:hypothetical protein
MGFKSPVNRMNTEEQKELLAVKSTTRGQLRDREGPWEGRLWEICQPMNKNLIRGRQDGTSGHNTAKFPHSVLEVNEAVGQWRFQGLPTEISPACGRVRAAARPLETAGVTGEKSAEVIVKWTRTGRMKEA